MSAPSSPARMLLPLVALIAVSLPQCENKPAASTDGIPTEETATSNAFYQSVPEDAEKTASGLASQVLQAGTGTQKPGPTDQVTVHYTGWTTKGHKFDSSIDRGQPATFPLNGVIKGWTEGLQLMVVGEKRRFWIPAELAYGENPGGGRPGGMLVFDVELIAIPAR